MIPKVPPSWVLLTNHTLIWVLVGFRTPLNLEHSKNAQFSWQQVQEEARQERALPK